MGQRHTMGNFSEKLGRKKQVAQGKLSECLLEFAEPMIEQATAVDGDPTPDEMLGILKIATMIWNAKGLEQTGRGSRFVEEVESVLVNDSELPPMLIDMVRLMFDRKDELFSHDLRLISDLQVFENSDGEFRLRVEARFSSPLMDMH